MISGDEAGKMIEKLFIGVITFMIFLALVGLGVGYLLGKYL